MLKRVLIIFLCFSCSLFRAQVNSSKKQQEGSETLVQAQVYKPQISLGVGMLSFQGDLYSKHLQAPWTGRVGYDLNISQRLSKPLQLNFNILFGKLGANEWLNNRQENFESEIRSGGISLLYDFGNFIPEACRVRPWISLGVSSFEFLSKTDLYDKNGNQYYYWSDGSIKNIDQNAANASSAVNLHRDYRYETDIRELNKDGFGKYKETAFAFPVGIGALVKVTDRFDLKIGVQYYFTATDYIDGITNNSLGTRSGTKGKDNFIYTSFALQYDLVLKQKSKSDTLPDGYFDGVDWLALSNGDYDGDGVKDGIDRCQGTPKGAKVDTSGCQFDGDHDNVPNESDDELATPVGIEVNGRGVGLTDEYWQNWYNQYMDSINGPKKTEVIGNFYAVKKDTAANVQLYTIELARYAGPVPNEEMAKLLSIGDVKSTVLADNSTVLYTAGTYKEIANAVKRRNEFIAEGNKKAQVGYFKNNDLITLNDDEINSLMGGNGANSKDATANEFAPGDIVYRVQLGAYKNKVSKAIFKNVTGVVELRTDDGIYTYATKGFKTIEGAANLKADLLVEGYKDAFITAYKNGKRIRLSETSATMETEEKEDVNTAIPAFSSVDKSLITFKIQLGAFRKVEKNDIEDKLKELSDFEKQSTSSGLIRYTTGSFSNYAGASKYKQELVKKGFTEAFVIALFKGEIISVQEAQELLK